MHKILERLFAKQHYCIYCKKTVMTSAILVNNEGNVCFKCYAVREDLGSAVEIVALKIPLGRLAIPCAYISRGCNARLNYKNFQQHKNNCKYRTIGCNISTERTWTLCIKELVTHFLKNHKSKSLSSSNYIYLTWSNMDKSKILSSSDCINLSWSNMHKAKILGSSNYINLTWPNMQDIRTSNYSLKTSCGVFSLHVVKESDFLQIKIYPLTGNKNYITYKLDLQFISKVGNGKFSETFETSDFLLELDLDLDDESETRIDLEAISGVLANKEIEPIYPHQR